MPEQNLNQPDYSVAKGDTVYALTAGSEDPLRRGTVHSVDSMGPMVKFTDKQEWLSIPNHNVYPEQTVSDIAKDLTLDTQGQEQPVALSIGEILSDPLRSEALIGRLTVESLSRYINQVRSPEAMGLKSVEALIGDEKTRGSNVWRINDMIKGLKRGVYENGSENELILARPNKAIYNLTESEAAAIRDAAQATNREMLDTLYDTIGVDFEKSKVVDSKNEKGTTRHTVVPLLHAPISIIETAYIDNDQGVSTSIPAVDNVIIYAGVPEYSQ